MNKSKKETDVKVRKTLVRDFEVKVPKKTIVCHKSEFEPSTSKNSKNYAENKKTESNFPKSILKNSNEDIFSKPRLNTIKKLSKQIQKIDKANPKPYLEPTDADLAEINRKVGGKLNFHINETVYKDLVALNVGGANLKPKTYQRSNIPIIHKDVEPNLDDFYENQPMKDKPIIVSVSSIKTSAVGGYDGTEMFRKFKSWELQ